MDLPMRVLHRFAPLDVPSWVTRFLDHWRPDAAGFVESEIWPNIVSACGARGIPIILINARMSARSYTAWSRVPWAARFTLRKFTRIHARSEEDALRLRALGAERVEVVGDLKRSTGVLPVDPIQLRAFSELFGRRPVFVAASTHPGEEIQIKAAHDALRQRHSDLLTIIAPRHPERGEELARLLHAPRRQLGEMPPHHGLWIADTLGELGLWYRLADVSFIGRSLIPPGGGQNPLEPARLGCAVAVGAFTSNFTDHVALLGAANAIEVVADLQALIQFVDAMLMDPRARWRVGQRAKAAVRGPDSPQDNVARTLLELIRRG
jgi:3-deoxy-D-manno-octulosonic-acid transferase